MELSAPRHEWSPTSTGDAVATVGIPESAKPGEARRVQALCSTFRKGCLTYAMVGSSGRGRRVNRRGAQGAAL